MLWKERKESAQGASPKNVYSLIQHNTKESGDAGCNQGFDSKTEVMTP